MTDLSNYCTIMEDLFDSEGDDSPVAVEHKEVDDQPSPRTDPPSAARESFNDATANEGAPVADGPPPTMEDLFGEDSEDESDDATNGHAAGSTTDTGQARNWMELPPAERPSEQASLRVCRLPAAVSYIPRGFNPKHFSEADDDDVLAQKQKPRASETLIRWRFRRNASGEIEQDSEGHPIRESNTRIVEWEDGSLTMHIGSSVYNMRPESIDPELGFLCRRSKAVSSASSSGASASQGRTSEQVLEMVGSLSDQVILRPTLDSEQTRRVVLEERRQRENRKRVRRIEVMADPEKDKERRVQEVDQLIRQQEAERARAKAPRRAAGRGGGLSREQMLREEEEEAGMQYDDRDVAALKRAARMPAFAGINDDDDDEEEEALFDEDEEESSEGSDEDDEDEDRERESRKRRSHPSRRRTSGDLPEDERASALRRAMESQGEDEQGAAGRRRGGEGGESDSDDVAEAVAAANADITGERASPRDRERESGAHEDEKGQDVSERPRKRRRVVHDEDDDDEEGSDD